MWMITLQVNDWVDWILGIKEKQRLRSDDPNAFFRLFLGLQGYMVDSFYINAS